ncbi:hypothetical protein MJO28_004452 [Puccinia striiformis f. sp. tritici]|uniref:Uncharacterized protein n=1 Tax=Puccinia striiformis f. sp. tritici TaxID=168172 RepID=A0ACC0ESH6_9BASI|nr:hypothetical protein MJO28_004452 [Puccinia striiformis f. sp. tritici]KAI7963420.1 hypothetical protein MJO29_003847 [Puccinia striiformis f. sp. tritici]
MRKTQGEKNEVQGTTIGAKGIEDESTIANPENGNYEQLGKNGEHEDQEICFDIPPANSQPKKLATKAHKTGP